MRSPALRDVVEALDAERVGTEWKALCPCHEDTRPSLSITEKSGRVLVICRAGCDQREVWERVCAIVDRSTNGRSDDIEATYEYVDENGDLLFEVVRYRGKRFRQRRKVRDAWVYNLGDTRKVPYRVPDVLAAVANGETIYVVEGEKDVEAIERAGATATCNPGGAGKWSAEHAEFLRDAHVCVVADEDLVGRKHARDIARSIVGVARSVRVVRPLTGKDASDHLEAGHTLDEFVETRMSVTRAGAIDGAAFILDAPQTLPLLWGRHLEALWVEGETLLIVGPQGVGKSTLLQQLALARIGIRDGLLRFPVARDARGVLYIAADRPSQIRRSFARMVSEDDREALRGLLHVWQGPLPFNLSTEPDRFAPFVEEFGAGTVFIDSIKDVALDLSKDESGSRVNAALQETLACEVEVVAAHHQRKAQANNKKPTTLADVYGSTWITAGAGSVVLVWGDAGDSVVEFSHLKQPAEEVGPLLLVHDHGTGTTDVQPEFDVRVVLRNRGGVTVRAFAETLFSTDDPDRNQIEKARRRLEALVRADEATFVEREREGGGKRERIYHLKSEAS